MNVGASFTKYEMWMSWLWLWKNVCNHPTLFRLMTFENTQCSAIPLREDIHIHIIWSSCHLVCARFCFPKYWLICPIWWIIQTNGIFLAGKTIKKTNKKDAKMDRTLDESSEALCPKVYVIQKFFFSLAIQIKTN